MSTTRKVQAYLEDKDLLEVTARAVAGQFGISTCTLRRKLRCEGTCLTQLIIDERWRRFHEANTNMNLEDLTEITCFTHKQSFQRAFKSRFGMPITEWRERV